jgi:hypothetical protein
LDRHEEQDGTERVVRVGDLRCESDGAARERQRLVVARFRRELVREVEVRVPRAGVLGDRVAVERLEVVVDAGLRGGRGRERRDERDRRRARDESARRTETAANRTPRGGGECEERRARVILEVIGDVRVRNG